MHATRLLWFGVLLGAAASTSGAAAPGRGTARPSSTPPPAAVVSALLVSPEAPELEARPALVERLRETPHDYFRFVSRPFAEAVCRLFADVRGGLPDVNLHGDAHVEQYAVTSLGHGLTDFDDSAQGPYVVDLVRFGVSLELVSLEKGWAGAGGAIGDFLRGYRDALVDPGLERPPRRTIRRARAEFTFDHALALRRVEELMDSAPVRPSELETDFQSYAAGMRAQAPLLPAGFFRIKKAGRLTTGIGSALDEKYLLRVEGWTTGEEDDQVLEAKLVHALADTGCLHTDAGFARVAIGMSLVARSSFPFSGFFAHGQRVFWVHGWTDDYVELRVESSFPDPEDLREVAYDVGNQLGRAHPEPLPGRAPPAGLRSLLLASTRANEGRIHRAVDELTEAIVEAWKTFRRETGPRLAAPDVAPGRVGRGGRPVAPRSRPGRPNEETPSGVEEP
jgi:Uncharacterized protein conserved in bacteria (DUF2252)